MNPEKPKIELPDEKPSFRLLESEVKADPLVQLEKDTAEYAKKTGRRLPPRIILGEA
jgi:hypothetical protein